MQPFGEREGQRERGEQSRSMGPVAPPQTTRRIAFTRKQRIGIPLLTLMPLLALLGVFGERRTTIEAQSSSLAVSVQYPTRFRYRQAEPLEVTVRNLSSSVIDTIDVVLDTAYMTRFSGVRITPQPRSAFTVALTAVRPGEQRLVAAEVAGEQYGRHHGRIVVSAPNDSIVVRVRTLVFP